MDIKSLKYFLATAKEGNITKAAEKLFMAQPPLSRQIQKLEEELGVKLFVRGKRHLTLTQEGRFLKDQAQAIIELAERTENQIAYVSGDYNGIISIGVTEGCAAGVLSEIMDKFHNEYPLIKFNIWCGNGDEIKSKLEKGLVDIGIVREPFNTEEYEKASLRKEPWIVIMSNKNKLAQNSSDNVEAAELKDIPLFIPSRETLMDAISDWFTDIVGHINTFCTYNTISCILPLIEKDMGVAICPNAVRNIVNENKLCCKIISKPEHWSNLMIIKERHKTIPYAAECFWKFAKENISNI